MKTLVALVVFAFSIPMGASAATIRRGEVKEVQTVTDIPECADGMEPGTLCRYVPLNAVTFNIPNVQPSLPPLPLKIVMPAGMRAIQAQLRLEVSPSTVCDPAPSDVYDGVGGLTIDCSSQQ